MPNSPEPTPKVFISYAWKNQTIAKRLQSDLQRDGVEVFVDYEKIAGGDSLPERISAALDWCNTLVLLWSADSAQSYYVSQEWTSAFHLQKRIIAGVLDGTPLPALLAGRLYLNFTPYENGYSQLCRSLGVVLKPGVEKTPPPAPPKRKPIGSPFRPKPGFSEPVLKPPEVFDNTKDDDTNSGKTATPSRWSRRKIMNTALAFIIVAAIFFTRQLVCQNPAQPISQQLQPEQKAPAEKKLHFRDKPATLSEAQVKDMLRDNNFYCSEYSWSKNFSNPQGRGFANSFQKSSDGKTVFDRASGLTWQQAGSDNYMPYADAEKYVRDLNTKKFAGFNDWRLPTLEEAMSLMESVKKNGDLYIDPVFDKTQGWIWTADQKSAGVAWFVTFFDGYCINGNVVSSYRVRAVRSGQSIL